MTGSHGVKHSEKGFEQFRKWKEEKEKEAQVARVPDDRTEEELDEDVHKDIERLQKIWDELDDFSGELEDFLMPAREKIDEAITLLKVRGYDLLRPSGKAAE